MLLREISGVQEELLSFSLSYLSCLFCFEKNDWGQHKLQKKKNDLNLSVHSLDWLLIWGARNLIIIYFCEDLKGTQSVVVISNKKENN